MRRKEKRYLFSLLILYDIDPSNEKSIRYKYEFQKSIRYKYEF